MQFETLTLRSAPPHDLRGEEKVIYIDIGVVYSTAALASFTTRVPGTESLTTPSLVVASLPL
jgi:hypothetical protein